MDPKIIEAGIKTVGVLGKSAETAIETIFGPSVASRSIRKARKEIMKTMEAFGITNDKIVSFKIDNGKVSIEALGFMENFLSQEFTNEIVENIKKQINLDDIIDKAEEKLKSIPDIPDVSDRIDPDWISSFKNHAKNISSEEMQDAWAEVLSKEIVNPGSYSLRSLNFLRLMNKKEAELFVKVAKYVFIDAHNMVFLFGGKDIIEKIYGINFYDIDLLTELGLIINNTLSIKLEPFQMQPLSNGSETFFIFNNSNTKTTYSFYSFSSMAKELMSLFDTNNNYSDEQIKEIFIRNEKIFVEVHKKIANNQYGTSAIRVIK